ncbi:MAG: fructosamine kinase family protein [Wenzhouxiangella sp.]|jgi:fructosamine-3-kinase|nr:fructosamine kinase family protein [Wenzhouxiangella sp.]
MAITLEQADEVIRAIGLTEPASSVYPVAGGDTSQACVVQTKSGSLFVKIEPQVRAALLMAEADGLAALATAGCVRVPRVLGQQTFEKERSRWLALEALDLKPRRRAIDRRLGQQLAELHRCQGAAFGWHRDNYLGSSVQANPRHTDWTSFFRDHRLLAQIESLRRRDRGRILQPLISPLLKAWERLGAEHNPVPSLLHGDLWTGNAAALSDGAPVIFDPAVHFGDRECDLAMANLFGGFSGEFFSAYDQSWPRPSGWQQRRGFYELYHVLNHANIFGGGYIESAEERMKDLIKRA